MTGKSTRLSSDNWDVGESRIKVAIDPAGLEATVQVVTGDPSSGMELREALAEARVRCGIHADVVEELAQKLEDGAFAAARVVIATGSSPEHGKDAIFDLEVKTDKLAGKKRADGSLDFRERGLFTNVEEGQVLATYTPTTIGTPGETVRGESIDAEPGQPKLPRLGDGVELDSKTGEIRARLEGVVLYVSGDMLDVTDFFKSEGDVDYTTGNLKARGTLWITGSVRQNFTVEATVNVIVEGELDNGTVLSGGNVTLKGGVIGREAGLVRARGNIQVRHANGASLTAGATLTIGDHTLSSNLTATDVRVVDGKGRLSGGTTTARQSIQVQDAGSPSGVTTVLIAGCPIAERQELRRQRLKFHRQKRASSKRGGRATTASGRRTKGGKGGRESTRLTKKLAAKERQVQQLESELLAGAEVVIKGTAQPGVQIRFGDRELPILDCTKGARFTFDTEEQTIRTERINS